MEAKINKHTNSLTVDEWGLKLDINPYRLLTKFMDDEAKLMLQQMVESKFSSIVGNLVTEYTKYQQLTEQEQQKIDEKEVVIQSIYDYAVFIRQISCLSERFELDMILESSEPFIREAIEWACRIYRYSTAYGYKDN